MNAEGNVGVSVRVRLLEGQLWSSAQPRNRLASEGDLEGREAEVNLGLCVGRVEASELVLKMNFPAVGLAENSNLWPGS